MSNGEWSEPPRGWGLGAGRWSPGGRADFLTELTEGTELFPAGHFQPNDSKHFRDSKLKFQSIPMLSNPFQPFFKKIMRWLRFMFPHSFWSFMCSGEFRWFPVLSGPFLKKLRKYHMDVANKSTTSKCLLRRQTGLQRDRLHLGGQKVASAFGRGTGVRPTARDSRSQKNADAMACGSRAVRLCQASSDHFFLLADDRAGAARRVI